MRETFTFRVELEAQPGPGTPASRWLTPTGKLSADPDDAAEFTFHPHLTMRETMELKRARIEAAGGERELMELRATVARLQSHVRVQLEEQLWPEGLEPLPEDPAEARAVASARVEALDKAFAGLDSYEKRALVEAEDLVARIEYMARWRVMAVDVPDGWEDIAEVAIDERLHDALWSTWLGAVAVAQAGKQLSSAQ